jgi:REP element-mobilizing transposase RayT
MDKFQNKYRIPSARLQNWDYGWDAAYFVTICTANRELFFGDIMDDKMRLSPVGIIADIMWHEIKNHAKNVELDVFQVMPNHIHGIIVLNGHNDNNSTNNGGYNEKNNGGNGNCNSGGKGDGNVGRDGGRDDGRDVETRHALSLRQQQQQQQPNPTIGQQRFQNQGKNTLSSIIGSYKSAVTKHANRLGLPNGWQSRFHDHIIRKDDEFDRIRNYIINNPANWNKDKFNGGEEDANG